MSRDVMERLQELHELWRNHRRVLEELLAAVGDEHMHFKPWSGAMSLGELALHTAASAVGFLRTVKMGEPLAIPEVPECRTMADVRDQVRALTEQAEELFASLGEAELMADSPIPHPKLSGPRIGLIQAVCEHEIHHKGQLFVYARMVGADPLPFFR